jgi:hypothetical protein
MSITGGSNRAADPTSSPRPQHTPWQRFAATAARTIIGAGSLLLGLVLLFRDLPSNNPIDPTFLLLTAVLVIGGAVLLALPGLRPRTGLTGWVAGGATAASGLAVSSWVATETICCTYAHTIVHGFPFTFLVRGADGVTETVALIVAGTVPWEVDRLPLVADTALWAYTGLIVVVSVGLARRAAREPVGGRP